MQSVKGKQARVLQKDMNFQGTSRNESYFTARIGLFQVMHIKDSHDNTQKKVSSTKKGVNNKSSDSSRASLPFPYSAARGSGSGNRARAPLQIHPCFLCRSALRKRFKKAGASSHIQG